MNPEPINNPTRAIFCSCTTNTGTFDTAAFVESIILFDEVILSNPSNIAEIIRAVGIDGFDSLLDSGNLCILAGGPTAQALFDYKSPGFFGDRHRIHRPLNFGFEILFVDTNIPKNKSSEARLRAEVGKAKRIVRVKNRDLDRIFNAIWETSRSLDPRSLKQLEGFQSDVESKQDYVVGLLIDGLAAQAQIQVDDLDWKMSVKPVDKGIFRVETNIGSLVGLSDVQLHEILKDPFYETSGTYLQLERMRQVNAASGLSEGQAKIVSKRLDFLSAMFSSSDQRESLGRIIEFTGAPRLKIGAKFDAPQLLKLRDSDEARAFRDWIHGAGHLDKKQVEDLYQGWKNRIGESLNTKPAGLIKWLASTGFSALSFPGAGGGVTLVDKFLKKRLPGRGPIGFIGNGYAEYIKKQKKKN